MGGVVGHELAGGAAAGEGDGRGLDPLGRGAGDALLEEGLALHSVDPALHHGGALAQVADDGRRALDVVVDEVELRQAALGEEGLGGAADAQLAPVHLENDVLLLGGHDERMPGMPIPDTLLLAVCALGPDLPAERAARALARGVRAGGMARAGSSARSRTARRREFDERMRRARAVIVGAERLSRETLAGSAVFEIATRARQAGVPAYAVTGANELDAFDARMLDLQLILEACTARGLTAAGKRLARLA